MSKTLTGAEVVRLADMAIRSVRAAMEALEREPDPIVRVAQYGAFVAAFRKATEPLPPAQVPQPQPEPAPIVTRH